MPIVPLAVVGASLGNQLQCFGLGRTRRGFPGGLSWGMSEKLQFFLKRLFSPDPYLPSMFSIF